MCSIQLIDGNNQLMLFNLLLCYASIIIMIVFFEVFMCMILFIINCKNHLFGIVDVIYTFLITMMMFLDEQRQQTNARLRSMCPIESRTNCAQNMSSKGQSSCRLRPFCYSETAYNRFQRTATFKTHPFAGLHQHSFRVSFNL